MKKFFKKLIEKFNEWFTWLTSEKVMEAINNEDMTYEEVVAIVKEEMAR